jgi:thiopurine S-methyltransferase
MNAQFWHERWESNQIGFHQEDIHYYLQEFWPHLNLAKRQLVFVPLCGKSNDMLWLLDQGYQVLGIELSSIAIEAFFKENQLVPRKTPWNNFPSWEVDEIRILGGDYFALSRSEMVNVSAVYDRASLIALPEEMRMNYVKHLATLLNPQTPVLLITLTYPPTEMNGPPFSVNFEEIYSLYQNTFAIQHIATKEILAESPHFQARGLTSLTESAYLLKRF